MAPEVCEAGGVAGEIWGGFCLEPGPLPEAGEGMTGWGSLGQVGSSRKNKNLGPLLGALIRNCNSFSADESSVSRPKATAAAGAPRA